MPLELTSAGRPVQLSPGTSVQLELNSPLFDEDTIKGSFSYSFSVPAGPNGPLYGFPERPDGASQPGSQLPAELGVDGLPLLTGSQRIKAASPSKYSVSVQAGLSGAKLSERQLSSFAYGGLRQVPRWLPLPALGVQYPGLVQHANEVAASPAAYDYVFAPLRNEYRPEGSIAPDVLEYGMSTVNRWRASVAPLLGMPAGGSFLYFIDFRVPGAAVAEDFQVLPPMCPFPKLRYVLRAIFAESGLVVDLPNLLPGELGDLVIATNAQLVDRGDATTLCFSLADALPALTVAQLLAALRQDLGVVVYVDPATGWVRSRYLAEQVVALGRDLSQCLAGAPELSVDEAAGLTLSSHVDGEDELTKDELSKQPDPSLVLPAVATVADLPATAVILTENPQTGQVRLVQDLGTWYTCTVGYGDGVHVQLTWAVLAMNLPPVAVAGGGQVQEMATCYTQELPTRFADDPAVTVPVPALSQLPYRADQPQAAKEQVSRSAALRLLFYNGLVLAGDGVSHYPQLSHQSASGAYALRLAGPTGTYAQWLAAWLPVKLRAASYKQPLLLTPLELARLDLTQPLHLAGVPYLVRKLTAALPLRRPATAELVRLF